MIKRIAAAAGALVLLLPLVGTYADAPKCNAAFTVRTSITVMLVDHYYEALGRYLQRLEPAACGKVQDLEANWQLIQRNPCRYRWTFYEKGSSQPIEGLTSQFDLTSWETEACRTAQKLAERSGAEMITCP